MLGSLLGSQGFRQITIYGLYGGVQGLEFRVSKNYGYFFGGPTNNEDYAVWGSLI